ncbi:MAG: hypothetical protein HY399_09045 [Elusimicrobia bacterium]|nr:hypothetical protein [Elusimicrobiota bacterium]
MLTRMYANNKRIIYSHSIRTLFAVLFVCGPQLCWGATFHDLLPGGRANGMGLAYTAVADDVYSLFYNPAGLASKPRLEVGSGLGRRFSPLSSVGEISLAYARPVPDFMNSVIAAGYYGVRQNQVGDKDVFLFSLAQAYRVPRVPNLPEVEKPVKWGVNFRMESVRQPIKSRFGIGLDAGAILESSQGLKFGMSLMEMVTGVGASTPFLNFGAAYPYRFINFVTDVRIRKGLTEFYPGMEMVFLQGLLAVRTGKGVRLDGVSQVAFGLGVNFSPLWIDYAMTIPWKGFHEIGGMYQVSVIYRFGVPSFMEGYVGRASERSEALKREIAVLEERKKNVEQSVTTTEVNKSVTEADLKNVQMRLEDTRQRLKNAELEMLRGEREKNFPSAPKPKKSVPPPPSWPQKHRVHAGDTLRSIAAQYYGDPNLWELIYDANLTRISRGLPQVDSVLMIPAPPPKAK